MILESLAANRGKAIYCAIDQSDTWTKAETWAAGRDRNERDDTVYFGESGNFRGFLSAQEGYLTDGESGVTGVSRELIFEFPREQRRGKKTVTKRLRLAADNSRLAQTPWGDHPSLFASAEVTYNRFAREAYDASPPSFDWDERAQIAATAYCASQGYPRAANVAATTPYPTSADREWIYNWDTVLRHSSQQHHVKLQAAFTNTYTAVCQKKVRVRRR